MGNDTITKLSLSNYLLWSINIRSVLDSKNLSEHYLLAAAPEGADPAVWAAKDTKARGLVARTLSDDITLKYSVIAEQPATCHAALAQLAAICQPNSALKKEQKIEKFRSTVIGPRESPEALQARMLTQRLELAALGVQLTPEEMSIGFLKAVKDRFPAVVSIQRTLNPVPPIADLAATFETLHDEEISDRQVHRALAAEADDTKGKLCWLCQSPDHIKFNCPQRGEPRQESRNRGSGRGGRGGRGGARGSTRRGRGGPQRGGRYQARYNPNVEWTRDAYVVEEVEEEEAFNAEVGGLCVQMYLDSCATVSMVTDRRMLANCVPQEGTVRWGNGSTSRSTHVGDLLISDLLFQGVIVVPELRRNLLSARRCVLDGWKIHTMANGGWMEKENTDPDDLPHTIDLQWRGNLLMVVDPIWIDEPVAYRYTQMSNVNDNEAFFVDFVNDNDRAAVPSALIEHEAFVTEDINVVHRNMGHINAQAIKALNIDVKGNLLPCETCAEANFPKTKFGRRNSVRAVSPGDYVHSDVQTLFGHPSLSGMDCVTTFLDESTRMLVAYVSKGKKDRLPLMIDYCATLTTQTDCVMRTLTVDGGMEYHSNALKAYCRENGIEMITTPRHTPEMNGFAERVNRTLMSKVRADLVASGLPEAFWAESLMYNVTRRNCTPMKVLNWRTPWELWYRCRPTYKLFHEFGQVGYVRLPPAVRSSKLEPEAIKMIFVGCNPMARTMAMMDPETFKITMCRDVKFIDTTFYEFPLDQEDEIPDLAFLGDIKNVEDEYLPPVGVPVEQPAADDHVIEAADQLIDDDDEEVLAILSGSEEEMPDLHSESEEELEDSEDSESSDEEGIKSDSEEDEEDPFARRVLPARASRGFNGPLHDIYEVNVATEVDYITPRTLKEALAGPDGEKWKQAYEEEVQSILEQQTWEEVDPAACAKPLGYTVVFKYKPNTAAEPAKYKARICVRGNNQIRGVNFDETFSPVVRYETGRLLIAMFAHKRVLLHQMDVSSAFLNGILEEEVFMRMPTNAGRPDKICKLKKALYGLKQSPRAWHHSIRTFLLEHGFTQSKYDSCLFIFEAEDGQCLIAVYVDDFILAAPTQRRIDQMKKLLQGKYKIRDLGVLRSFCAMNVKIHKETEEVSIDMAAHLNAMLERLQMLDCKPTATPMDKSILLSKAQCPKTEKETKALSLVPFRSAVGSCMYPMVCYRPDLAFTVSAVSRFLATPSNQSWVTVKRMLRYLKGTVNYGLFFQKESTSGLVVYCDADYAANIDDRRSTSGVLVCFNGTPIHWKTRRQPSVAVNTMEAEYLALAEAVKDAKWFGGLCRELRLIDNSPITIMEDNQACIKFANDARFHQRSKHIDVRHHFIRDEIDNKAISLVYCPTEEQLADALTKPLDRVKFAAAVDDMNIRSIV